MNNTLIAYKNLYPVSFISLFLLIILTFTSYAQEQIKLTGDIKDSKTKAPMAFCSIGLKNHTLGTVSNELGQFSIFIPDSLKHETLVISYLGYQSFELELLKNTKSNLNIKLQPAPIQISEVSVRPYTAREIIKKAINAADSNYLKSTHKIEGFYLEEFIENGQYVDFAEAFADIYNFYEADSFYSQAVLIEGRTRGDLGSLQFMREKFEKGLKKKEKKALKKGEENMPKGDGAININFGGPEKIIHFDPINSPPHFLKKEHLKKMMYWFEKDNTIAGKDLWAIGFESRSKIDHLLYSGTIYVDKQSLAIVKINSFNQAVIPGYAKTIMITLGLSANNLFFSTDAEYRQVEDKWYLSRILFKASADVNKRYIAKKKESADLRIKLAYAVTNVVKGNIKKPDPAKLIDTKEALSKQVGDYNPEFWKNKNSILRATINQ